MLKALTITEKKTNHLDVGHDVRIFTVEKCDHKLRSDVESPTGNLSNTGDNYHYVPDMSI